MKHNSFFQLILFSLCLVLISTPIAYADGDNNADGDLDKGVMSTDAASGLVIGILEGSAGENARQRLSGVGYSVDLVAPEDVTAPMLSGYDFVWIAMQAASTVNTAGKTSMIQNYVSNGGGLIVEQPNEEGTVAVLPYTFYISDHGYDGECDKTVLNPSHEIVSGLSTDDLLNCYDTSFTAHHHRRRVVVYDSVGLANGQLTAACLHIK